MKHGAFLLDETYIPSIRKKDGHIFLQLTRPVNASIKKRLKKHGVELLEYIPSNTWKARIPSEAVRTVKALKFVHAMGDIHPVDKFPSHVLEKDFKFYSYHGDGTVSVLVSFHEDISFDSVRNILKDISGITHQNDFISGRRALLRIPQDQIQALSGYDEVNWIEDRPAPKKVHNVNAAALSNIDILQGYPYDLDGSGVAIGEWDAEGVQNDHQDLSGRVTNVDTDSVHAHSTHVAGTIIGSGSGSADAKGMAPAGVIYSYDFHGDVPDEMSNAVSQYGISLSNNSWGYIVGWESNYYGDGMEVWFGHPDFVRDPDFGAYTSKTHAWDNIVSDTDLIIVKSAGNDRNDNGDHAQAGHHHYGDSETVYKDFHPKDGDYDCIGPVGAAKNIITVGAVNDSGGMLGFSSWGPMDDGRIKPDIVANGYSLRSTCPTSKYCSYSGTSMSSPVVTGAIAILIEHYEDIFGAKPTAALAKALLINTAVDKGNTGPDYSYGWGLLDAKAAVDLIDGVTGYLLEDSVSNGETLLYPVNIVSSGDDLKISIVWTDPAASPGAEKALVNDIDMELVDPFAETHRPWVLTFDPDTQSTEVTTGVNSTDNVEQIVVISPEPGSWTLRVKGTAIQGDPEDSQAFALVVKMPVRVPEATSADATEITTESVTLNGSLDDLGTASTVEVSFEWGLDTAYGNETTPQSLTSAGSFHETVSGLSQGTLYHYRAKAVGDGTDYGDDMTFTTNDCQGDFNYDGDADGEDLAAIANALGSSVDADVLAEFATEFGRVDCK